MNIELTSDITVADLAIIEALYTQSFPPAERRPWAAIASPAKPASPRLFAIIADGRLGGMLTLWIFERFAYIEHFAVAPQLRGKGVGTAVLGLLKEKLGLKPIVVEIEPPVSDDPATIRRRDFYTRNGFQTVTTDYVQPPYSPQLPSVAMHLLATAPIPATSTTVTLHREVYAQ